MGLCYGIFLDSITSLTGYYYGEQGWCGDDRLFTVLLFFCKIVEIDGFALRPAILHECQNYLEGSFFSPPSPYSYNPLCPPPWYIWKSSWPPLTVRCAVSRWSHEKIGDCEQATVMRALASHQCGPSWNPIVYTICGLNLLLIFLPCSGYSIFPSSQKPTLSNSNRPFTWWHFATVKPRKYRHWGSYRKCWY